jgi:MFS family permease
MTATLSQGIRTGSGQSAAIARRLRPLAAGIGLQNLLLWVPVEKLFMTDIGFDAAAIGVVAAVYSAVVPLLEVPFGVLADRWSRTGVLVLATLALAASSLVGGLSNDPAMYAVAAALLGVYFALSSGTADSIVYDTLVEETGSGDAYETWIGRLHMVEAIALVISAVLGGVLADAFSPRVTYFVSVPLVATSAIAFVRCREPQLHRATERVSFRRQAATTVRALTDVPAMRRVIMLAALTAVAAQVLFEFGPLWLVSAHAPSSWYGPYWAALVSTVGIGAWLASRVDFTRRWIVPVVGVTGIVAAVLLVAVTSLPLLIATQILVALVAAVVGVHASFLMHDAVQASIRAGVSSGASTLAWIAFVPLSLLFGWLSRAHGVHTAGWLLVMITVALAVLLRSMHDYGPRNSATRSPGAVTAAP